MEKLIGDLLKGAEETDKTGFHLKLAAQRRNIKSLCTNMKEKWVHELFSSAKDLVITRYVQYHQAGLTQLSNQISNIIPAADTFAKKKKPTPPYDEQILNELEQLLDFLQHQCYSYFDPDYKTTIYNCRQQCGKLAGYRRDIISHPAAGIEPALIGVIDISVEEMIADALQSGLSYRQAEHAQNLLGTVQQFIHAPGGTTTDQLARVLYRQNLNTLHLLYWYQDYIQSNLNQLPDKADRETFIVQQIKTLSTIAVNPEKAWQPELLSVDLALLPWLYEKTENQDLRSSLLIKTNVPVRLPLNLSVPQFAMFIRIFSQTGCFPDTNVSKITRFFSRHFSTRKQGNISLKSFSRAFYGLDQTSAAVVRDYLQKMINYVHKTYFPELKQKG
ncbi:hypothetical protein AB6735_12315 [Mucilaginibacter sp. RCC_168]|uniref:hypothetical protein n=1 Tax=unclassified Mucilaginibacter TaxID=2617802 RepID=UPI00088F14E7|nr:hypothetical protein [Mucilaginibacter sp. OK268]SDP14302.1 hypothetical protein SAMN05428975_0459 [Mucilaginibacter sp. OK268]